MAKTKIRLSVGRQNISREAYRHEVDFIASVRTQFKQISDNYEKIVNGLKGVSVEVLLDALRPTYELSQKYVPVDTGDLKESGFLERDKGSKYPRVVMGYGRGGIPNYAALVHERMDLQHMAPTKAKYLLSALEEDAPNIQNRIVADYKKIIGA